MTKLYFSRTENTSYKQNAIKIVFENLYLTFIYVILSVQ